MCVCVCSRVVWGSPRFKRRFRSVCVGGGGGGGGAGADLGFSEGGGGPGS